MLADLQSHVLVISGREGKQLQRLRIPSHEPVLHAPQILIDMDGNEMVLFVTGDLVHPGGLYIVSIFDLFKDDEAGVFLRISVQLVSLLETEDRLILIRVFCRYEIYTITMRAFFPRPFWSMLIWMVRKISRMWWRATWSYWTE